MASHRLRVEELEGEHAKLLDVKDGALAEAHASAAAATSSAEAAAN
eukprot:SAG11_NODE_8437_length_1015_cov_1.852620_3_plen_45_part_01